MMGGKYEIRFVVSGYSDGYIRKILTSLKEKKVIERQGGNKTGKWVVIN